MQILIAKRYGETTFITGMRAFAALAVVMIHSGGAGFRHLGVIGNNIANLGAAGPYVFYVISGFSVAASFTNSAGFVDYASKRLWRIAPLYYFWLIIGVFYSQTQYISYWRTYFHVPLNAYNLSMHLAFLSSLDYRIANSVLGVEWSISVEVIWYFLVPLLICLTKSRVLTIVSIPLALLSYITAVKFHFHLPVPVHNESDAILAFQWSPIRYLLSYTLGVAAFRLRPRLTRFSLGANVAIITSLLLLAVYVCKRDLVDRLVSNEFVLVSFVTFTCLLWLSDKSVVCRWLFLNRLTLLLGTVSYGIYLSHFPILGFVDSRKINLLNNAPLKFVVAVLGASLVSLVTYALVERPTQEAGRWLRHRSLNVRSTSASFCQPRPEECRGIGLDPEVG